MTHTLIVARMNEGDEGAVADLFAASDAGKLPRRVGVRSRTLFRFHGLYFHLIESADDVRDRVTAVRDHPEFRRLSERLEEFIQPYDPRTWRSPSDAMAIPFYHWHDSTVS